jgi:hypothetical protein
MKIIVDNCKRFLEKTNEYIDISDGAIVKYTGLYYTMRDNSITQAEYKFVGRIEIERRVNNETIGIYIRPLYILADDEWRKIINYRYPHSAHFFYPHLLLLSNTNYLRPLYFMDTIEAADICDYIGINKYFELDYPDEYVSETNQ